MCCCPNCGENERILMVESYSFFCEHCKQEFSSVYRQFTGTKNYMKVYIAGPITGIAALNRETFASARERIRKKGHVAFDPHMICAHIKEGAPWEDYMKACIPFLCLSDAVCLLPGSDESLGARVERQLAETLKIPVFDSGPFLSSLASDSGIKKFLSDMGRL